MQSPPCGTQWAALVTIPLRHARIDPSALATSRTNFPPPLSPLLSARVGDSCGQRRVGNMEAQQACSSGRLWRNVARFYTHVKLLVAAEVRCWYRLLRRGIH